MQFDVVVIGGGLAGLSCAVRLCELGKRCVVVSSGQSALYFSSGSFDLLARLPDGTPVDSPLSVLPELAEQAPQHPYSLMGMNHVVQWAGEAEHFLRRCGINIQGSCQQNHLRITPLGSLRKTWLSPHALPVVLLRNRLPWKKIVVLGIEGFLDFQPHLFASTLKQQHKLQVSVETLHLPVLDHLRNSPSEFRSINIARVLDLPVNYMTLLDEIKRNMGDAEAIFLPACLGLANDAGLIALGVGLGKPICLLPTLPPSLFGMRIYHSLRQRLQQLGGVLMPGDTVLPTDITHSHLTEIYTRNHGDIPLRAKNVVLASGSFFSNGLKSDYHGIREGIFGLDVYSKEERADWSERDWFAPQPYLQFGVQTDTHFRAVKQGRAMDNLYAIGSVVGGYDPVQQGCGAGVSLLGALHVAHHIVALGETT